MAAAVHHTARLGVAHTAHLCGHGCICRVPGMRLPDCRSMRCCQKLVGTVPD